MDACGTLADLQVGWFSTTENAFLQERNLSEYLPQRRLRVVTLLAMVVVLNAYDLVMTLQASSDGMLQEANPIGLVLIPHGHTVLVLFKAITMASAGIILFRFRRHWQAELCVWAVAVAYTIVAIQWQLCYEVYEIASCATRSPADLARIGADLSSISMM